ncbi:MAG: hypothetical protein AAFR47_07040 [Pseudomonadota bacterium]
MLGQLTNPGPVARSVYLGAALCGIWAIWSAVLMAPGEVRVDLHEGDMLHLADLVLRMAQGLWPHIDYMTPLGVAGIAPIAAFVSGGMGLGQAFLAAQVAVAACFVPMFWWIGVSRLRAGWLALGLGALGLTIILAMVHGGEGRSLSVAMHYNRWAWAAAYGAMALALLPPVRAFPLVDGVLYGLLFSVLALTKIPYFVAFLPGVLVALAARGEGRTVLVALGTGAAALLALTLVAGPRLWPAYLGDLLTVMGSTSRVEPTAPLFEVVAGAAALPATALAFVAAAFLRQGGQKEAGLTLLVLVPGFFLVTWQNFGNDPQWLPFLGLMLLALRPAEDRRLLIVGVAALALGMPSAVNTAMSAFRHRDANPALYVEVIPGHPDLTAISPLIEDVKGRVPVAGFAGDPAPVVAGEALPVCHLSAGSSRMLGALAEVAVAAGQGARPAFLADLYGNAWLFGAGPVLEDGAPWHYAGLPGGAAAEVLLVPDCPVSPRARDEVLAEAEAAGWVLTEIARGPAGRVYEIGRD